MIRTYAKIVGIVLILLSLAGFTGVMGMVVPASFFHAAVGVLFAYAGFVQKEVAVVRTMVGGMGVLLLVVKVVTILSPSPLGEAPLSGPIEITCLVVGLLSVLAAKYLRDDAPTRGTR